MDSFQTGVHNSLLPFHVEHLRASGISEETARAAGVYSEVRFDRIQHLINCSESVAKKLGACIVFPYHDLAGRYVYSRIRPDRPRKHGSHVIKYETPKGESTRVYFPPGVADKLNGNYEILFTEGEKKALAATQAGFPTIGLSGVWGWKSKNEAAIATDLRGVNWKGRQVIIAFDSDVETNADVQKAESWLCHYLKLMEADVGVIRFPSNADGSKVGLDDFIVTRGAVALRSLCDAPADPVELVQAVSKIRAKDADPSIEAQRLVDANSQDDFCKLRYWSGSFWQWSNGRYREIPDSEVRAMVTRHLDVNYCMVERGHVANTLEHLKAKCLLPSFVQLPSWLRACDWRLNDIVSTKNKIIHLPSYVAGQDCTIPATPALFTTSTADYQFSHEVKPCDRWMQFLNELWPDDPESMLLLQEWFGYCLTPDTSQQKILLVIGPKRSGKGTFARTLRSLVGEANVCGPTLSSLQTNFGLWPLLGKSVAIISDARLSGRSDQAVIAERLLSISGEDAQTIDRKNMEPVTTKLLTRFCVISNELPRLQDASGALASRLIILRLTKSFFGVEDRKLTERLHEERDGILHWAIEGWRRLNERGYFLQPSSSDELAEQMTELSSPITAFCKACCQVGPQFEVEAKSLYDHWCSWCDAAGRRPETIQMFGRDLSALYPSIHVRNRRLGAHRARFYEGIGIEPGL